MEGLSINTDLGKINDAKLLLNSLDMIIKKIELLGLKIDIKICEENFFN